jgi:nucleoside-triphosphatase THEP1
MTSAWKRAAVFGSVWAASEIVLGNLLHTLRVPFAGTFLAAIGVSVLVAGLRLRGEPGVAIRAGVVCALMKSVAPGAVIIGPMVGIMLEAAIVEGVTLLTRRSIPGFVLAGALATATPILQKVGGLLIVYGPDAARIYLGLYEYVSAATGIEGFGPLDLVLVFVGAAAALGAAAAGAGVRMATLASRSPAEPLPLDRTRSAFAFSAPTGGQAYSRSLLVMHLLALALGLSLISQVHLWAAALPVAAYGALSFARYRRVAQKLLRPRLWIEFAAIGVLAALALGVLSPGGDVAAGLAAGTRMVMRGILVIVALSCVSVELRNPIVVEWFLGRGLGGAADALRIAAGALPGILRLFGDERMVLRHPVRALSRSLAATVAWIDDADRRALSPAPLFILTGAQGIGKTARAEETVRLLREDGIEPGGVLSPAVRDGGSRSGYDLLILGDGRRMPLARLRESGSDGTAAGPSAGRFTFFENALAAGRRELDRSLTRPGLLVIVDEVGPLELRGQGWAPALIPLIVARTNPLILVVRPSLVTNVCRRWGLEPVEIWDGAVIDARTIWTDVRLALTDRALYSDMSVEYLQTTTSELHG